MRVIFLSKRYWPAVGGVERHIEQLSQALQKLRPDIQISIITEQHDAALPVHELHQGVEIHRIPMTADIKKSVWDWMKKNVGLLSPADLIHVHDVFFWLLPVLPNLRKKKIYTTFHGYEPPGPPNWRQRSWHQIAEVLSDGNICVGGFHQKWYGVEPTFTTFGAVDDSFVRPESKAKKEKEKFLFVGRLADDTSVWSYLEAFAKVSAENKKMSLDIIGDGPLRQQLEWFVDQEKLSVRFLGAQPVTAKTFGQYSASFVSGYLTILESLASGVPVISTYFSSLKKDYLENTPFRDWISIAPPGESLVEAIKNPQPVSPEAKNWAHAQTWDKMAEMYLQLWAR